MPPKKRSGPAFEDCPLNEREVKVVIAALRHLSTKPTVNEPAMAQALGFTNVRSAKNSFFRILKSLGNDPIKLPSTTDATSKTPTTRRKRSKQGHKLADTPPPEHDNNASNPVPSIEEAATTADPNYSTKGASKGKEKADEDASSTVDEGCPKVPNLGRQHRRSKRVASAEPVGKEQPFKRHRRFEHNDDE
ncbi:hypothetical protein BKA80DRAFT_312057 [Phyllosticta citrichinensis]